MEPTPPSRPDTPFLDIEEVSREIRRRVQGRLPEAASCHRQPPQGASPASMYHRAPIALQAAEDLWRSLESGHLLAGDLPPQPPTVRGKLGQFLVHMVRRMLFWYTPPLRTFQQMVARALREQAEGIRKLDGDLRRLEMAGNEILSFARRVRENDSELYDRVLHCERELHSLLQRVEAGPRPPGQSS